MSGIYIHIPFCKQACHYCNFHFSTSLRKKPALINAICKEIQLAATQKLLETGNIDTVYFGGGTPSLMDIEEIEQILAALNTNFNINPQAEITLEANPDDISEQKLTAWKKMGINRLSIGIQSFFEEDLRWMNRAHNADQAINCLQMATQFFDNITIDLIYGVPGLTNEKWKQNVNIAIDLGIPHLSCYALTVEPKTPLDKLIKTHKKENVDEEKQSEQFLLLMKWLAEAGYEHYEISNFAKPGFRSRHNSSYWKGESYLGLGPAAHSFNGAERWWNVANNQKYIDTISEGIIPFEKEELTAVQKLNEYLMISLRTIEGIDLKRIGESYLYDLLQKAEKHIFNKSIIKAENFLKLTDTGKLYADGIAADLFF